MVVVVVAVAVVSQRVSCVKLCKTFRNHVNEAGGGSSAAKLFALEISWFNMCNCAWLLVTAAQLCRRNSDSSNEAKTVVKLQTALQVCIVEWWDYKNGEGWISDKHWQNEKTSDSWFQ